MSLCANLNELKKIGNKKISLKLPFDTLIESIDIIALQHSDCSYHITNLNDLANNQIQELSVIVKSIFIGDNHIRQTLAQQPHQALIQQIQYNGAEEINNNNVTISTNFNYLTKGYFIEGNIDLISEFELCLNGHTRWRYNDTLLNLYAKRISNNLLYVPFNGDVDNYLKPASDRTSYVGALNSSGIDQTHMKFRFSENYSFQDSNKIKIYALSAHKLAYHSGFAVLQNGVPQNNQNQNQNQETVNNPVFGIQMPTLISETPEIPDPEEWEVTSSRKTL